MSKEGDQLVADLKELLRQDDEFVKKHPRDLWRLNNPVRVSHVPIYAIGEPPSPDEYHSRN